MIPDPTQRPFCRRALDLRALQGGFDLGRQPAGEFAPAQGFHHYHAEPLGSRVLESFPAGLAVLIEVVVLDLTELPVVGVDYPAEILLGAVERRTPG